MAIPMVNSDTVFNAIVASQTLPLQQVGNLGGTRYARSIILEVNGASTPNWTLDIQGRVSSDGTYHNIDYLRIDQGATNSPANAQLTVTWTTAQYYVIPNPPPIVQLVAVRTGGALTVKASFSSEAYSFPPLAATFAAVRGAPTDRSGTITAGNAAQQIMAANAARNLLTITNDSNGDLWVDYGVTAVLAQPSTLLVSGASITWQTPGYVPNGTVSIIGATTSQAFTAKEG